MTPSQRKSLDHHLSEYPKDKSYEEVIALIEAKDESVLVWQKYENDTPEDLVEYIEDMIDPDELDTEGLKMFFDGFCQSVDDVVRYTGLQQADAERAYNAIQQLRNS